MTIKGRLFLGFGILLMIFISETIVNYKLSQDVIHNMDQLGNSEAIIRNSNILHKNIIEMQSGFRGFLLTGQESFLQPYYEGLKEVPPVIEIQKSLLVKPVQKERLNTIINKHKEWIAYANSLISTKIDTLPESNLKYQELFEQKLRKETGKKLNDEINVIFAAFDSFEYNVRHKKREVLQASIKRTRTITKIFTGVSVMLALFTAFYITRVISRRISLMVSFAEEISKGNFQTMSDTEKDELKKLSESLNIMSQTLERNFKSLTQKNIELDRFAYVVSHDLKAPLRGIDNLIKWTEEDHKEELTPGIKKNIELIKGRTIRLENMINGLLEYARIGRTITSIERVNVEELLKELIELIVPPAFKVQIQVKMPAIVTHKIRLEQVFSNLLSNAVKYSGKNEGNIWISCKDKGEQFEFSVSDDGVGIDPIYYEKIFEMFQTLQERDAFESTGIGLAIVKKIVEEQKGIITVSSEPGKGSTFTFTWPKVAITKN